MTIDRYNLLNAKRLDAMGVAPAAPADVPDVHRLATGLLGQRIASEDLLARVQAHNPRVLTILRPEGADTGIAGFLALLPLNGHGLDALWCGLFDPLAVDTDHVAPADEDPAALYIWGIGAPSTRDKARIWAFACFLETEVYPDLPHFARPATARGEALMRARDFCPMTRLSPGAPDGYWVRPSSDPAPDLPLRLSEFTRKET